MTSTSGSEERWRELRSQGAELDAAARGAPGVRRLSAVREGRNPAKPLGLVLLVTSYPLVAAGIEKALEDKADVRIGANSSSCDGCSPSCVVLCADAMEEGLVEGMERVRKHLPYAPLLVFGQHLDLALAAAALKRGADGFVHAAMAPEQVARAIEVAQKGELAAPRQLLGYLLGQEETPELGDLSARQREVLELVVEDLSNAEIAGRLYLSESTIKQHLRAAYKLLGVRNRTEAANMMKNHAREL